VTAASLFFAAGVAGWPAVAHADKPATTPGSDKGATPAKPATPATAAKPDEKGAQKVDAKKVEGNPEAKPAAKAEAKSEGKVEDKSEGHGEVGTTKGKSADRASRAITEREAIRQQLSTTLHGPMTEAIRQELRRHAQRVARIERIETLALEQKDKDAIDRAKKLLAKENDRHEKWMSHASTAPVAKPAPAPVADPHAKVEQKGGAQ
jgi:hypothetical protein